MPKTIRYESEIGLNLIRQVLDDSRFDGVQARFGETDNAYIGDHQVVFRGVRKFVELIFPRAEDEAALNEAVQRLRLKQPPQPTQPLEDIPAPTNPKKTRGRGGPRQRSLFDT